MGTGILDTQSSTNSNRSIIKMSSAYSAQAGGGEGDRTLHCKLKVNPFLKLGGGDSTFLI